MLKTPKIPTYKIVDIFQQILSTIVRPGKPILRTPVAEDIFQQILSTIVRPGKPVVDT